MKNRDFPLKKQFEKWHPWSAMAWLLVYMVVTFLFQHPLLLAAQLLLIGGFNHLCGVGRQFAVYMRLSIPMAFLVTAANVLCIHNGATVLYQAGPWPLLGSVSISLEALTYGVMMSLRLMVVMGLFCLYNHVVSTDRLIKTIRGRHSHMLMATVLSIRMMPLLAKDVKRIMEVYRCRGVRFETGSMWERIKALYPIAGVLLQSSLERSITMAESMTARGYGLPGRTQLKTDVLKRGDFTLLAIMGMTLLLACLFKVWGQMNFEYYPRLTAFDGGYPYFWVSLMLLVVGLSLPMLMPRRWSR